MACFAVACDDGGTTTDAGGIDFSAADGATDGEPGDGAPGDAANDATDEDAAADDASPDGATDDAQADGDVADAGDAEADGAADSGADAGCVPADAGDAGEVEVCNGLDDDCDGNTDEEVVRPPADRQDGVCAGALKTCMGEAGFAEPPYAMIPGYEADEATCDGLDNDCDGSVDEGLTAAADRQDGVCAGAEKVCDGANGFVEPDYGAIAGYEADEATCDGADNDCDGSVDEALDAPLADRQAGVCAGALKVCAGAGGFAEPDYAGIPGYAADEASCDGVDNDCDGATDEPFEIGQACVAPGLCGAGVYECGGVDAQRCSTAPGGSADGSAAETCDGQDEDCDGAVDEGLDCVEPGELDPDFGADGIARLQPCDDAEPRAAMLDGQGRLLIAGGCRATRGQWDMLVARVLENGALDGDFADAGVRLVGGALAEQAYAIAGTDRALVAGYVDEGAGPRPAYTLVDGGGAAAPPTVERSAPGSYRAVVAHDGGFVLAGEVRDTGRAVLWLARRDADGAGAANAQLSAENDTDFHARGLARTADGAVRVIGRLEGGADDRGAALFVNGPDDHEVFEYDAGAGDTTERLDAVAASGAGYVAVGQIDGDVLVVRIDAAGALDAGFGAAGRAQLDLGARAAAHAVAVDAQGRIYVAGRSGQAPFLLRLTAAGALDDTFAGNGRLQLDLGAVGTARAVLLADRHVVVVGRFGEPLAGRVFAARVAR